MILVKGFLFQTGQRTGWSTGSLAAFSAVILVLIKHPTRPVEKLTNFFIWLFKQETEKMNQTGFISTSVIFIFPLIRTHWPSLSYNLSKYGLKILLTNSSDICSANMTLPSINRQINNRPIVGDLGCVTLFSGCILSQTSLTITKRVKCEMRRCHSQTGSMCHDHPEPLLHARFPLKDSSLHN